MTRPDDTTTESAPARSFAIEVAVAMVVFTTLVFIGMFWRNVTVMHQTAREQASSYLDLVVNARTWNAGHGGVWVAKRSQVRTNPYLRQLGVEPDTSTASGVELTMRNPAVMTREMSTIAEKAGRISFRITSLKLVNPQNAPDAWERESIRGFDSDLSEVTRIENGPSGRVVRAIRPLLVEQSCLRCHSKQDYRIGEVRGAISVTVPFSGVDRAVFKVGVVMLIMYLLILLGGGALGSWLVMRMSSRIDRSERELQILATTDSLTGIPNRRSALQRLEVELARAARLNEVVGVLELDIDHFKEVNDTHGHNAGDEVLRRVSACIVESLRGYDSAGRLGGEEFLVVAPGVDTQSLSALAERLRIDVEQMSVTYRDSEIRVTTSIGTTLSLPGDTCEIVIGRADAAMYAAKAAGRNRVRSV